MIPSSYGWPHGLPGGPARARKKARRTRDQGTLKQLGVVSPNPFYFALVLLAFLLVLPGPPGNASFYI